MSFLQNFMLYNEGNECPKPYVLWTAYGLLSAAVGHRVYMDLDYFFVRCDTYIILIGPSGGRKTAAMVLGSELLKEAIPDISLSGDNETYQGIITFLNSDNSTREYVHDGQKIEFKPYHIFAEELMDYLQLNPVAMVTFLTNIYGKKFYRYRLKNEDHLLINPYITMCACSVPEWLTDQLKAKQFSEGYGRRAILVCHEGIIRRKPVLSEESKGARDLCKKRLLEVLHIVGPMVMEKDAHDFFWHWYTHQKDPSDPFLRNWRSTWHLNLLKVAMLTSISERDDRVVTLNHVKLALGLLIEIEKYVPMVTSRMGKSEVNEAALTLLEVLRRHGGRMSQTELKKETFIHFKNGMEQYSTMMYLKETRQIIYNVEKVDGVDRTFVALPQNVRKESK